MKEGKSVTEFEPEWCLVNVGCGLPNKPMPIL